MRILIIDGQGGGIGARLVSLLRPRLPEGCELLCAGTNSLATSAMLKAGAARGATGENALCYNAHQRGHHKGTQQSPRQLGHMPSLPPAAVRGGTAF